MLTSLTRLLLLMVFASIPQLASAGPRPVANKRQR